MSDGPVESADTPELKPLTPVDASAEQHPPVETKEQLVGQAMVAVDRMITGAHHLANSDIKFAQDVYGGITRLHTVSITSEHHDPTAPVAAQIAEQTINQIDPLMRVLHQQAEALGVDSTGVSEQIQQLLQQTATAEDPQQATQLADQAIKLFAQTRDQLEQSRQKQMATRAVINQDAQDGRYHSYDTLNRIANDLGTLPDNSTLFLTYHASEWLDTMLTDKAARLSAEDTAFLEDNHNRQQLFKVLVGRIAGQEPSTPPETPTPTSNPGS